MRLYIAIWEEELRLYSTRRRSYSSTLLRRREDKVLSWRSLRVSAQGDDLWGAVTNYGGRDIHLQAIPGEEVNDQGI